MLHVQRQYKSHLSHSLNSIAHRGKLGKPVKEVLGVQSNDSFHMLTALAT